MSRFRLLPAALALVVFWGCPSNAPESAIPLPEEEPAAGAVQLLSVIHVAQPEASDHLLSGFHGLEQRAWRWTEGTFAVLLEPPPPVPMHTPELELIFSLPQVVLDAVGAPISISATIDGQELEPQTFDAAGENLIYKRPIPEGALGAEPVRVEFTIDKPMPPSDRDPRELGVIAVQIGIQ